MAAAIYLVDTSAYARIKDDEIGRRIETLWIQGRLALCQMVALEILNTAEGPESYERNRRRLFGHRWIDVTTEATDRAMEIHRELGARSQHRDFSLPDLIIAATAELNGATVLHYDHDYDRIAKITGQPTEWVAAKGSV